MSQVQSQTQSQTQSQPRFVPIFAWWILASLAGYAVGIGLGALITLVASSLPWVNPDRFMAPAALICIGLSCGAAQSFVLRGVIPNARRWIMLTLSGYLLAWIVALAAGRIGLSSRGLLLFALMGAAIGLPQWLLLRGHIRWASLWVPVSAAGFLSFLWIVAHPVSTFPELIIVGAISGAVSAILPAIVLQSGLSQSRQGAE
jgi:hypothetical protein